MAVPHYHYKIFGLSFDSEIEIIGLMPVNENPPDVLIRYGNVPDTLENATGKGKAFESNKNDFLYKLSNLARFRVQNGTYITVQLLEAVSSEKIGMVLLGSIFSGLFIQRGLIPIHGSAVTKDDRSVIFSGESQVGKSSLAFALSKKGYTVVADDLALVDCRDGESLILHPGVPFLKLWKDVVDHFNLDENLQNIRHDLEKYINPLIPSGNQRPLKFDRIAFIKKKKKPGFSAKEITGFEKFNMLMNNSFRIHFLEDQNQIQNYFINLSRLAHSSKIFIIERPESPLQIMEFADFVIGTILEV